ncbi:hypothetical protein BDB00DRAFT_800360 [Zychaea mexicana]|uniref:uncharacterized protein n=1 Tax=Zychaea mexicana TaxID=64656 RepID=UPI0022FF329C|nr:uncharacterized protein BDB00DRAFT_800360 [Zychaea mexicana]KAI9498451.1 hypothetical protein BDB00DRAFT_800360 [Zychaea mexicana]
MDFRDGDAVICYPQGCPMRFKYQCDPFYTMWNTHFPAHVSADVTSLHLGKRLLEYNGELRRPVYGTTEMSAHHSKAQLWRLSMPSLADMDPELALFLREHQQSPHRDSRTARTAPVVAVGNQQQPDDTAAVTMDCTFSLRRNNFWTCSVDDDNNSLVVGCDTGAYMLTSTFNILGRATARTAVLASSCIPDRPGLAWLGCRDSEVKMFDPRIHSKQNLRFKHSSLAIAHLKALDSYRVLAIDVGESLAIWDMRFMANNKRNRPLRRLKGHVNTAGTRIACDVNQTKQLLALAGNDHCVRLWSLNDSLCSSTVNSNQNLPFWESQKFGDGPVQAVQFIDDPPPMASAWEQLPAMSDDRQNRAPGLVVAAPVDANSSSSTSSSGIHWLTL